MKLSLAWNACTNYLCVFLQTLQGIFITRRLIAYLGDVHYGLWSIIWSFFMYAILLDFGLGLAAQKTTATELYRQDIKKYNQTIASVIGINMSMSLVIIAATLIGCACIRGLLNLPPDVDVTYYRKCLFLCGIGSAITFPLGVFTEILVGLHKMYIRNYVTIAGRITEMLGIWLIIHWHGDVLALLLFTLACTALRSLAIMIYVRCTLPGFRLGCLPSLDALKGIANFSFAVYTMSLARLAWMKAAPLILSIFSGLSAVGMFHVGNHTPCLLDNLISPSQETFAPLAAKLYSYRRHRWLTKILIQSMQLNAYITNGMAIGMFIFSRPVLRFLFNVDRPDVTLIAQLTVLSIWLRQTLRALTDKYLLMAEQHRQLAGGQLAESALYLALCVTLVKFFPDRGGIAVMVATLITQLVITFAYLLPCALRSLKTRWLSLFLPVVVKPLLLSLPMTLLAAAEYVFLLNRLPDFPLLILAATSGGLTYVLCIWFRGLSGTQRFLICRWLNKKVGRRLLPI